jgi:hypothetical protein
MRREDVHTQSRPANQVRAVHTAMMNDALDWVLVSEVKRASR